MNKPSKPQRRTFQAVDAFGVETGEVVEYDTTTEAQEQQQVIKLRDQYMAQAPLLGLLAGSANGEKREKKLNPKTGRWYSPDGQKLKRMGLVAGWPDLQWPIPRRDLYNTIRYCGLFIEQKIPGGKVEAVQSPIHALLREAGNYVHVSWSWVETWDVVVWYGRLEPDWRVGRGELWLKFMEETYG